jgi:hypothetical protein
MKVTLDIIPNARIPTRKEVGRTPRDFEDEKKDGEYENQLVAVARAS